jgi:transcription-repair coupling factor (superfamily II helicase)
VLEIEYAEAARLYLPVDQINLLQKYRNPGESRPRLDRLGSQSFVQAKNKAEEAIEKLAHELLDLYASREVFPGFSYAPPDHTFREFEASFEYEETPDQEKVIEDVLADLSAGRPMDRLVLGDVGYGKTEVALRAGFLAAMQGKQVAVLCPTTILAQQHFNNFQKRLKDWPLQVRMLSRFSTRAEQKKIIEELKTGLCDVVIGTHRLLSRDVEFKDLGLLIVDEEQRFGVVQKERVKQLKKTVDCLTLSATPIPRTMQMTMLGLRDLSVINTPPPDRQAIHTELVHFEPQLIREAVLRELKRQGQVFFVHNRVQGIDQIANWLAELVPEAKIAVAHGQMDERRLEKVMRDFYLHKYDVLVSTAIIENGLDLPSANTIIINRADQFGLAQLYQLRGRIGRSRERGYAYLVVPSRAEMKADALKRLKALKEFTELGAGFRLAAYDLKIRGAGNLLGREQSGQISRIGYELYLRLLENKVKELKGQKLVEEFEPRVKLALPAFLPEEYVPADSERLAWYKRLAMAKDETTLNALRDELVDRYGKIPEPAENLLQVVRLKFSMRQMKIPELDADDKQAVVSFAENSRVNFERLLELVQSQPDRFRLTRDQSVIYFFFDKNRLFDELTDLFVKIRNQSA